MNHPGAWTMIAQRRTGTHHLAHVIDPDPVGYVGPGSVKTECAKYGRPILSLGGLPADAVVCKSCLKRADK